MKSWKAKDLQSKEVEFEVLAGTELSQFASMALKPGDTSGEFGNEHADSDQWLVVLEGSGEAKGESETTKISAGDIVLIPAPENHQIKNTGKSVLKTISFYAPVAYKIEASATEMQGKD